MHRTLRTALAAAAAAALAVAPASAAKPEDTGQGHRTKSGTVTQPCTSETGPSGNAIYEGPLEIWPPNHKYLPATATWKADDANDTVEVTFTAGHDQIVDGEELPGSGNTDNDITPAMGADVQKSEVVQDFQIRGERSGTVKAGRTYTIGGVMTITDDLTMMSTMCDFSFEVRVPHDQGKGNDGLAAPI